MVIYCNGIKTGFQEAMYQAKIIEAMVGGKVGVHYNPTNGLIADLKESFWNKFLWFWKPSKIVMELIERIGKEKPEYLIGHSQGCMIVLNAVRYLSFEERTGLKLILFASPKVMYISGVDIEYFVCEGDQVLLHLSRSALIMWQRGDNGFFYVRDAGGHGFIEFYLNEIEKFVDVERSLFHSLMAGK